ncbi:MAG: 50S ribosomal protein L3 N(5)-glutamine methyltransferase [Gammaproteobacteria bacterium]|nr:50S ribosomal protein L3 N(5)-glutamine methyltransferase [Gammaproteobacteria bacterium]MDH5801365.1 50S ribosomal protein L3 N(5)-glutamine methyltransferase [Gammaproteobacteria bacterium]
MKMSGDELETLTTMGDMVRWGASRFNEAGLSYGHGTDNALDEAYSLVRFALHLPHDIPAYMLNSHLSLAERKQVLDLLCQRVETRLPAPYLTHEAWFAGLAFYVDQRVLIPRSPIAELIHDGFEPWINSSRVEDILDLCTGSACIAIACAQAFPDAAVVGTDISAEALEVARINIDRYDMRDQVRLQESDVFAALEGEFDVIVSNPPYVNRQDMEALTEEFRHEPGLALAAGGDGLDIVKRILSDAARLLKPEGILVVEVGNSYPELLEQYPQLDFTWPEFSHGGHGVFILSREQLQSL